MKKVLRYISKYFTKPIISFVVNIVYWIFNIFKLSKAIKTKNAIFSDIKTLSDVEKLMGKFDWTKDKFIDWYPWIITIINNDLKDDCDGAAALGKAALKKIGISSKVYHMYSGSSGHAVAISNDKSIVISNSQVLTINSANWEKELLGLFNNKYDQIVY